MAGSCFNLLPVAQTGAKDEDGVVNNSKTHYKFRFDGILPMKISQDEVFNQVAKPVIEDVLQGINGTIFAYGQTGSGKTFTITGGSERYEDRGLIPRTISYLFEEFKSRRDATYRMFISYLEIYNNDGCGLCFGLPFSRASAGLWRAEFRVK
ncbi:KIF6 [Symbiodinium natans]|uniref:KIF6 protein n=1 Tax=Symbiodinium natans TaxID=878477 RepID=A0A812TN20_9DINO|nr:KIF6 [Symbiodinium natans]